MLSLVVGEFYDEEKNQFINSDQFTLKLEHSLLSISKWESIWQKPFLHMYDERTGKDTKTREQNISYIRCMTLNKNVPDYIYDILTNQDLITVAEYLNENQTATWFSNDHQKKPSHQIITSELIYYWMTSYQIPWEAQKWHLSRLLTLVRICNANNQQGKKMSKSEIMARNKQLNDARRATMNTKG